MEQKNKNMLIGGLLAIVLVMAVGYAAFATQLTINGTANITSNWDVHIQNIEVDGEPTGTAENVAEGTKVDPDDPLKATFSTKLVSPGDSITYKVTVVNAGTLPAEVSSITVSQKNTGMVEESPANDDVTITGTQEEGTFTTDSEKNNPIVYSVTEIKKSDTIEPSNQTKEFKIKVEYNPEVTGQPEAAQLTSTLTVELNFIQHTDSP